MITYPTRWRPGFLETHFEKLLLSACIGVAGYVGWMYVVNTPNKVDLGGRLVTAGELDAAVLSMAEELDRKINIKIDVPPTKLTYARDLRAGHDAGLFERAPSASNGRSSEARASAAFAVIPERLPQSTGFVRTPETIDLEDFAPPRDIVLVTPLAPRQPTARAGRSMVRGVGRYEGTAGISDISQTIKPAASQPLPVSHEQAWVTVSASLDIAAQQQAFAAGGYDRVRTRVYVVAVEAQRSERLASDEWSAWRDVVAGDVNLSLPIPPPSLDDVTGRLLNRDQMNMARTMVRSAQGAIMRPVFFETTADDAWKSPIDATEIPGIAPKTDSRTEIAARKRSEPVWFNDFSAAGGKTYRYRLRLRLWNTFVGQAACLRNPLDARRTSLEGAWSEPTNAVVVPPTTHFFVQGAGAALDTTESPLADSTSRGAMSANVEVWKWVEGRWLRRVFNVASGEVLGGPARARIDQHVDRRNVDDKEQSPTGPEGTKSSIDVVRQLSTSTQKPSKPRQPKPQPTSQPTAEYREVDFSTGVLVLEIRSAMLPRRVATGGAGQFEYRPTEAVVVVYRDPLDGVVRERIDFEDRADPLRRQLAKGP